MNLTTPDPIYDAKELQLVEKLTAEYIKFTEPGKFNKALNQLAENAYSVIPGYLRNAYENKRESLGEQNLYKNLMEVLTTGFATVEKIAANFSVNEKAIIKDMQKKYPHIDSVDKITFARSYDIQKTVKARTTANYVQAFLEGAATGIPGAAGLPFNIVLSTALYYRVVQNIAMHYGYDVKNDPAELEFAGEVFITAFTHGALADFDNLGNMVGKIMMQCELTLIKTNVRSMSFKQLAEQGGVQLLYVQVRALANKAARNALENVGEKSLEKSILKNVLKIIGKNLPKRAVGKSTLILGGVIGALFDTAYMDRVIKGANLIYHKRFLLEKETRVKIELGEIKDFSKFQDGNSEDEDIVDVLFDVVQSDSDLNK